MSKTLKYIQDNSFDIEEADSRVVELEDAVTAIKMSAEETKERCESAFRGFIMRFALCKTIGIEYDLEEEFNKTMKSI